VGEHLGEVGVGDATGLDELLATICRVLRLPWASLAAGGSTLAVAGVPHDRAQTVPLRLGGEDVGQLTVGLRRGESHLGSRDLATLRLLSTSVAVAVHATTLAGELSDARSALVTAREKERRRLSRDLHDGLGPLLTGVILKADAARRFVPTAPAQAEELMLDVRDRTAEAVTEIRRLVRELRPPALDQMGLTAALQEYAAGIGTLTVSITSPPDLPHLEPAVEVALYRIATEAMTNVVRHSRATAAGITLRTTPGSVLLDIRDNGGASEEPWTTGVGLASMRERAIELGGTFTAGPDATGGHVRVMIPCGSAR
jgi:two-component system NarL family sensor kinase